MTLKEGLFALLSTDTTLVPLHGTRVYPILLPENAVLPATVYQIAGGGSKPGFTTSGPQRVRMQLDHVAKDAKSADALRDATKLVLDGFTGELPNGFVLTSVMWIQLIDHFDSDARQFRCAAEYYFSFNVQ